MLDFTVAILEGAYPTSVSATVDVLDAARALSSRTATPSPKWRVCSVGGGNVPLQRGVSVETSRISRKSGIDHSIWVVPGLGLESPDAIRDRLQADDAQELIRRLRRHVQAGGRVGASCSSVFLLQAAGLLDGRRATTSWWLAPLLKKLEPGCHVDADRMVCEDGPVVTAGAAMAQTDLMLTLLRLCCGSSLAEAVSRMLLIDARQAQAPFVVPAVLASGDALVAQLTSRIEAALPRVPRICDLASELCMSQRTLARQIHKATGRSPLALVQSVRLQRARALLERSRIPVERVAEQVGYHDPSALRRLMKKCTGATPSRYRPGAPGW